MGNHLVKICGAAAASAMILFGAGAASAATVVASTTNEFNFAEANTGLGAGPFGTVTVEQLSDGSLAFMIQLFSGIDFNSNGNGQHHAFTFDLSGAGVSGVTISHVTAGFTGQPTGSYTQAGIGTFNEAVTVTGHPTQGSLGGTLDFDVTDTANNLTLKDLHSGGMAGGRPMFFSADVYDTNVNPTATGNVGAVPEPGTWAMMLLGLFGVGALLWGRQARLAPVA